METKERQDLLEHANFFTDITSVTKSADKNLILGTTNLSQFTDLEEKKKVDYLFHIGDDRYKVHLVDERLLYSSLFAWRDLSLTSLFQRDNETILDNTHGKLECAKEENYLNTLRVAKALLEKNNYYIGDLYEIINKMIEYQSFRPFASKEHDYLSEEFFKEVYAPLISRATLRSDLVTKETDISNFPKDIQEFSKSDMVRYPKKLIKKYYRNK